MPQSARQAWPFPDENEDPFFDSFTLFVNAVDASVYASREDKNYVLLGGGTISFNAGTNTVAWTEDFALQAATTGFYSFVPGTGSGASVTLPEGQFLYVQVTRGPQSTQSLTPKVASVLPPGDDFVVLAYRYQNRVYWRNGAVLEDGGSLGDFAYFSRDAAYGATSGEVLTWNGTQWVPQSTSAVVPSGTGFFHITGGVKDPIAVAVDLSTADVTGHLPLTRLTPPTGTGFFHVSGGASDSAARAVNLASADITGVLAWANITNLAGDVTGAGDSNVVAKIHGASVPAAGSLVTGNVLQVSGGSALSYGPVNLAGGANFVTGVLPDANLPTLGGDVTGTLESNHVVSLSGLAGTLAIAATAAAFVWAAATASPSLGQAANSTASATGQTLSITGQGVTGTGTTTSGGVTISSGTNTGSTTGNIGDINYVTPAPVGSGTYGRHVFSCGGLGNNELIIEKNPGLSGVMIAGSGTYLYIGSGTETINLNPQGSAALGLSGGNYAFTFAGVWGSTMAYSTQNLTDLASANILTRKYGYVDNSTASATGGSLTIAAQNATGTTSIGGDLFLTSGTGTSTNGNGATHIQVGGADIAVASTAGGLNIPTSFLSFGGTAALAHTGSIRFGDIQGVALNLMMGRNTANTSDRQVISSDGFGNLFFGDFNPTVTELIAGVGSSLNTASGSFQFNAGKGVFFAAGAIVTQSVAGLFVFNNPSDTSLTGWKFQLASVDIATIGQNADGVNSFISTGATSQVASRTISANYVCDASGPDEVFFVDTSAGTVQLTLPTPRAGRRIPIADKKGTFGTNTFTLAPHSTEKIDGIAGSRPYTANGWRGTAYSDGTDWYVWS